ncbi:MAG: LytR/AlgR family response regulator transcription factor [Steroidobacteraceae bacterium]
MTPQRIFRALIVDDERLARQRLEDLLAAADGWQLAGTAGDGEAAVRAIRELKPDLVFLDIQMPGLTGIDVVKAIGVDHMPPTIFVTAYDQYALQAFDAAALDYLVKPFDDERFAATLRRAQRLLELQQAGDLTHQLRALLGGTPVVAPARDGGATPFLERIAVEMRGQVRVVATADIDFISASGPYAELHAGDKTYVIRERMQTLEGRLDPAAFMRIHRSAIVRLDRIDTLLREPGGDYAVKLRSGALLSVSRNRVEPLEQWMGVARQSSKNA